MLNTPVEDCDPEMLRLVLAALARHIADTMSADLGMDAEALFSTLCGRLGTLPGEARPDVPPAAEAAPTPPRQAASDAAAAPPVRAKDTEPVDATIAALAIQDAEPRSYFPDRIGLRSASTAVPVQRIAPPLLPLAC